MRIPYVLMAALLRVQTGLCFGQRIEVTVPSAKPLNGHLVLVISRTIKTSRVCNLARIIFAQGFGVDVENLPASAPIVVDAKTFGYPRRSLADLDAGDYFVQAVFTSMRSSTYPQERRCGSRRTWAKASTGTRNPATPSTSR